MRRVPKLALILGSSLLCISAAYSSNQPTTFLGPTARVGFTSPLTASTAYSFAGEFGVRNFRVGGTLGVRLDEQQRFKISADYLWQRINYHFFVGNTKQWVNQGSVGAGYVYDFTGYNYNPEFEMNAFYSSAQAQSLGSVAGTSITPAGIPFAFIDSRRVAGSDAGGVSPGLSIQAWQGGKIGIDANWDDVSYGKRHAPHEDVNGFGGTIHMHQVLAQDISLGVSAGIRKPFNDYEANIDFTNLSYYGNWNVGVFGNYVAGKNSLSNTWNLGLSANYFMMPCIAPVPRNLKGDYKGEASLINADNFLNWTADPAVHMPEVLAIPDERVL